MKTYTYTTNSAEETIELGKRIGSALRPGDVLAMQGTLGAGKTTITKGIAEALKIDETITSPTFCLISEYEGKMPLYHFDVYRLGGTEDFADLGADEMIYGKGVCVIEWSEKIMSELPKNTVIVRIEKIEDDSANANPFANAKPLANAASDENVSSSSGRKITLENWSYGELM